jgi:hypothetical protein
MDDLLEEVEKSIDAGLYYVGLFACLMIPDVCAALESADGKATAARYAAWVERHMARWWNKGDGQTLYQFRNSLLHQATGRPDERSSKPRLLFSEPERNQRVHMTLMDLGEDRAVVVDLRTFCFEVLAAARSWLASAQGTEPFETNLQRLIRRHPEGIPPFVVGRPVIG